MSVFLRHATPEDSAALSLLAGQTFRDGWAAIITPVVADAYVAEAFTPDRLAEEISDTASYLVVAVDVAGKLVGYARLTESAKTPPHFVTGPHPILLQRLYVAGDYRGQGIADALLEESVGEALRRGGTTLWLETDPRNERAWRFYVKRGYADAGETVYQLPGAVNDRIRVLQKSLAPSFRTGTADDADALSRAAAVMFADTFGQGSKPETMATYLAEAFAPAKIAAELADSANCFLLAVTSGLREEIIGYAKLGFAPNEEPSCVTGPPPIAELERFYVRHQWHGAGVADTLMKESLKIAWDRGAKTLWLGVFENNPRALRFYRRWAFRDVGEHVFLFGNEEETDIVMMRILETA